MFNLADDVLALWLMADMILVIIVQCSQVTSDHGIWTDLTESSYMPASTDCDLYDTEMTNYLFILTHTHL